MPGAGSYISCRSDRDIETSWALTPCKTRAPRGKGIEDADASVVAQARPVQKMAGRKRVKRSAS